MGYLVECGYILLVVAVTLALHRYLHVGADVTRKLTHILIGFVFVIQYHFFREDALGLLLVPSLVTVGLLLVARFRLLPSMVNPKNPYGIFYYAFSITLSNAVAAVYPPYLAAEGAAVACLAFGDGFAALLTSRLRHRHALLFGKSWEGTLICFLFAAAGIALLGLLFPPLALSPWLLVTAAAAAAVLELISGKYDNPAIVLGVGALVALLSLC